MLKYSSVKRILDIVIAAVMLGVFALPMLLLMLIIRSTSQGSAIFRQKRVGKSGREFVCFKLRTMYQNAPKNLSTAEFRDAEFYITPIGRLLRRTSLDELPQLLNVLRGDMSIVGPRPLIPEEKEMHKARIEMGIYKLRPGITGLAQVRGRDMLSDEEKLSFDAEYSDKLRFTLDIKIIFLTFFNVTIGKGVASAKRKRHIKG